MGSHPASQGGHQDWGLGVAHWTAIHFKLAYALRAYLLIIALGNVLPRSTPHGCCSSRLVENMFQRASQGFDVHLGPSSHTVASGRKTQWRLSRDSRTLPRGPPPVGLQL